MNWTLIGILLIVGAIVLWIINEITYPLSLWSPWATWIKNNTAAANCAVRGGVENLPVTCIPQTQMAYYMSGNKLFYNIATLFDKEKNLLKEFQIEFLMLIMRSFAKDIVPGGILTPKDLCCNIVPYREYGVSVFKDCVYDSNDDKKTSWNDGTNTAKIDPSLKNIENFLDINTSLPNNIIPNAYPGGAEIEGWQSIRVNWISFMVAVWGIRPVCQDGKAVSVCADYSCQFVSDSGNVAWGGWSAPSNFLYHVYGIPATSPLVVSFCLDNWNDTSGIKLNSYGLAHLLGCTDQTIGGGWIGFVKAFSGGDYGVDDITNYIWANYAPPQQFTNASKHAQKSCNTAGAVMTGISNALAAGGLFAMLGAFTGGLGWVIGAGIATAAIGTGQGLLAAGSSGCFNKNENLTLDDDKDKCDHGNFPQLCCPDTSGDKSCKDNYNKNCPKTSQIMKDWHSGVIETSTLDIPPACLLPKTTMSDWEKTDPTKFSLLQKITCEDGKTGSDCWNTANYTSIFGPVPDGNALKHTNPDGKGNCIHKFTDGSLLNIGPVEPPHSKYPGQCIHNIFYCNGNGICENEQCTCTSGYDNKPNCVKKNSGPKNNYKCVFGSGAQTGKCGHDKTDWSNDQFNGNNCGPKNNTGWCDIKHFCKDGLTEKQAKNMCTYNNASDQKTECKSTKDGGTQIGLPGCNNTDNVCCWQNGNVVGCQTENDKPTDPPGTRRGVDKDGNEFLQYFTGQWNNHGVWPFQTTVCSYSPYKEQALALGPG